MKPHSSLSLPSMLLAAELGSLVLAKDANLTNIKALYCQKAVAFDSLTVLQ